MSGISEAVSQATRLSAIEFPACTAKWITDEFCHLIDRGVGYVKLNC